MSCSVDIPGFFHHGNCDLLCKPASWTDVVVFFIGNYIAHAATVINKPGQSTGMTAFNLLLALAFPGAGIYRGIDTIATRAIFAPTPLQMAARAGALCMVVKDNANTEVSGEPPGSPNLPTTTEEPLTASADAAPGGSVDIEMQQSPMTQASEGEAVRPSQATSELQPKREGPDIFKTRIHGACKLPTGYSLRIIPKDSEFEDDGDAGRPDGAESWVRRYFPRRRSDGPEIANSYNLVKILVSIGQLAFAISTLYKTRGDQIALFGYAAFGLTVTPYAFMSLINLLGSLLCPQYSTVFLVENQALDTLRAEIRSQGKTAQFPILGMVGRLTRESEAEALRRPIDPEVQALVDGGEGLSATIFSFYSIAVPLSVIGGLSHFSKGKSKGYQRGLTMTWLVFGSTVGTFLARLVEVLVEPRPSLGVAPFAFARFQNPAVSGALSVAIYAGPAIGGFVVVGKMILQYGSCLRL